MTDSPGKFLKKERDTRNISLEEISQFTKIKEQYLKAIEEERYEFLPHPFYVRGYLKGYAKYLSLNPNEIILKYENYLKSLIPPEPIELPKPVPSPKKTARPWFLFSLIFAVILFTAVYIAYPVNPHIEQKPNPIPLFPVSPASAVQQQVGDQKIEILGPEKSEGNPSTPLPVHGVPRIDPESHFPTPSSKAGLASTEQVKEVASPQTPDFKVLEASIGTGIEREGSQQFLTGKCSELTCNNQRGYFFTRIKTPRAGKVVHIWLWEGKEYYRMEIDVKPPAWSVYSYFTFQPQHTGNWKAEARDGDQVLTSLNFKVIQSAGDRSL